MERWRTRLTLLCAALCILVHAQCIASCSAQPCGIDPKTAKLPPCHRKHLPDSKPMGDPCASPLVARASLAVAGKTIEPLTWTAPPRLAGRFSLRPVSGRSYPGTPPRLIHSSFFLTILRV